MNVLTIQSHVVYGHVGNTAAVLPMQRLGCEVWALNTVQFSNHTGHGSFTGRVFEPGLISDLVDGLGALGVLATCDAVNSGYMGDAAIGAAILDAATRVRTANPNASWCCDPVIGDVGKGIYVRAGIPEFLRDQAVPAADVITPNQFELELLTGREVGTRAEAIAAAQALRDRGPRVVLVTSVLTAETPPDAIDVLAVDDAGAAIVRTPRLPIAISGTGDCVAALFHVHWRRTGSAAAAAAAAVSSVFGVIEATVAAGSHELLIVAGQDQFVSPSHVFRAEPA